MHGKNAKVTFDAAGKVVKIEWETDESIDSGVRDVNKSSSICPEGCKVIILNWARCDPITS
jgi:hypothetical protein